MARIILGTYAFRYPLGGMLSWMLQWAAGFHRLGHELYIAEKALHADACYDPVRMVSRDDCSQAVRTIAPLLERHHLDDRWCFVDYAGNYLGMTRPAIEEVFRAADLFIDLGTHGAWLDEAAAGACTTMLVDGEPGYTQMRCERKPESRAVLARYHHHYSNGASLATHAYTGPTCGQAWRGVFNPVVTDLFPHRPPPIDAPFSTVMMWQSHPPVEHDGVRWGQKDVEFQKFIDLPRRAGAPFDLAVTGNAPRDDLHAAGWTTRSARETTLSVDAYLDYIARSAGEFSVCKHAYVALNTGWFSDRSAAYLAAGRPVVMQETGFSAHLPCGEGLFAVRNVDEAADAINAIRADYPRHAAAARAIAKAHLDAAVVLPRLLSEIGA